MIYSIVIKKNNIITLKFDNNLNIVLLVYLIC